MTTGAKIFIDWGSSNFRAFLLEGTELRDRLGRDGAGTLKIMPASGALPDAAERARLYSDFLMQALSSWLAAHPQAPVYICGAAGGREGWVETPYLPAPAGVDDWRAQGLNRLDHAQAGALQGRDIRIVSGCADARGGCHDVMRGEEVKALGAVLHLGLDDALLCIPGTHCKWVEVRGARIRRFITVMTGEFYNLLHDKGAIASILKAPAAATGADVQSFPQGLALAKEGQDLLADVWQVRAQFLRNPQPPADFSAYLSGILIGHEMRAAAQAFGSGLPVVLLADDGAKKDFYMRALDDFGHRAAGAVSSETAVCRGLGALSS